MPRVFEKKKSKFVILFNLAIKILIKIRINNTVSLSKRNSLNSGYVNIISDRFLFGYYTYILTYNMTCVVVYVRVLCTYGFSEETLVTKSDLMSGFRCSYINYINNKHTYIYTPLRIT